MKLIPHCRRVKIRIESGGYSCASLEALKQHFYIEDIIPLVQDGRLQRWLEDLDEDGLAQAVSKISVEANDDNKKQTVLKLFCTFLPTYFHYDMEDVLPSVNRLHDIYDHDALIQIIDLFKDDISKDIILTFWDELVGKYSLEEFKKIISPYKNTDKDVAYNWACFIEKKLGVKYSDAMEVAAALGHANAIERKKMIYETDCYAWRDSVKTDDNCPTTHAELETLFTETIPNGRQFCKFKPLESFYRDVWHIYNILKVPGLISKERYDQMQNLIYVRFRETELGKDPLRVERDFIHKLIIWHKLDMPYPYKDVPYSKSNLLLGEKARPVNGKGYIHFLYEDEDFIFRSLWKQILFVTVNIFNRQFYPDWK